MVGAEEHLPELHHMWVAQCAVVEDLRLHIALQQQQVIHRINFSVQDSTEAAGSRMGQVPDCLTCAA